MAGGTLRLENWSAAALLAAAARFIAGRHFDMATSCYLRAAAKAKVEGDQTSLFTALGQAANLLKIAGMDGKAATLWSELAEILPPADSQYASLRFIAYTAMATNGMKNSDWSTTYRYSQWALLQIGAPNFSSMEPHLLWLVGHSAMKMGRIKEAISQMEQALQIQLDRSLELHLTLRQILVMLYLENKQFELSEQMSSSVLSEKVRTLPVRAEALEFPDVAEPWGNEIVSSDGLTEFVLTGLLATSANYHDFSDQRRSLVALNQRLVVCLLDCKRLFLQARWQNRAGIVPRSRRSKRKVVNRDWLEIYFLYQSQSCWVSAAQLAFCGQVVATNLVLRGAMENAMYAVAIFFQRELRDVWLSRRDGEFDGDNSAFSVKKIWQIFEKHCPHLLERTRLFYKSTIEDGAHPNLDAFKKTAISEKGEGEMVFGVSIIQITSVDELCSRVESAGAILESIICLLSASSDTQVSAAMNALNR